MIVLNRQCRILIKTYSDVRYDYGLPGLITAYGECFHIKVLLRVNDDE
jgi:hypothetical protein